MVGSHEGGEIRTYSCRSPPSPRPPCNRLRHSAEALTSPRAHDRAETFACLRIASAFRLTDSETSFVSALPQLDYHLPYL